MNNIDEQLYQRINHLFAALPAEGCDQRVTNRLGMATQFNAWTFDGRLPGPTLEVCEGDRVTLHVDNQGTTAHGLDTHALSIDSKKYGPTAPGTVLTLSGTATTPGVFMYHCASGSVTDVHIKSGLSGAMVVHSRRPLPPVAREMVVVESAVFGERSPDGIISGTDSSRTLRNDATFRFFNGRFEHEALPVASNDRIRVYFVNVGPGVSAVHVIGSMLDAVIDGADTRRDVQTYGVPPGGGAIVEFTIPEAGDFLFVNHDQLGYVPTGLALRFTAAR